MATWYDDSIFLLHYSHPYSPSDSPPPLSAFDAEQLAQVLARVKPDAVTFLAKGFPGFVPYSTMYGNNLPYLVAEHDADLLAECRRVTREAGVRFVIGYAGLIDHRAGDFRSDWRQVRSNGTAYGNQALCANSGYVEELLLPQLAEIQERFSPDGFWLDGDNWAMSPCYCNACLTEYQMLHTRSAPTGPKDADWGQWIEFHRETFRRYVNRVARYLHDHGASADAGLVYSSNAAYSSNQPEGVPASADFSPDRLTRELSPAYSLRQAGLEARLFDGRGVPFDLLTWNTVSARPRAAGPLAAQPAYPKTFDHLAQEASVILANGGRWTLGMNLPTDDSLPEAAHEVAAKCAAFARERAEWVVGTESAAYVAVLHSATAHRKAGNGLFDPGPSIDRVRGAHQALLELHHPHDIVDEHTLLHKLDQYCVLILPEQVAIEPTLDDAITEWVRTGGRLIASGRVSPRIVEDLPTFALGEVLGIRWTGRHEREGYFGRSDAPPLHVAAPVFYVATEGETSTILPLLSAARESGGFESGYPAVTVNQYEDGQAFYLAADFFAAYYRSQYPGFRDLLADLLNRTMPTAPMMTTAPSTVEITWRQKGNLALFHFANHAPDRGAGENGVFIEEIPLGPSFSLTAMMPERPLGVKLQPGNREPEWTHNEGTLTVFLPPLHRHAVLVIETAEPTPAAEATEAQEAAAPVEETGAAPIAPCEVLASDESEPLVEERDPEQGGAEEADDAEAPSDANLTLDLGEPTEPER